MQGDSCQKAGKGAINPRRKSLHLNALDSFLPSQTNRENLVHSRDEGDISFRKSEMSASPLKADVLGLSTEVRYVPIADMDPKKRLGARRGQKSAGASSMRCGVCLFRNTDEQGAGQFAVCAGDRCVVASTILT